MSAVRQQFSDLAIGTLNYCPLEIREIIKLLIDLFGSLSAWKQKFNQSKYSHMLRLEKDRIVLDFFAKLIVVFYF